jgi:hypothetical protein
MRRQQRNALLIALSVLVAAGLVALFVLAPWRAATAPTTQPGQEAPPTAVPAPGHAGTLAVKIDNVAEARPQTGLGAADVVYVQPVEGGLTRLVAVYQQDRPELVGPVRSARQTDVELLAQYGRPVLAYSGAAPEVLPMLRPLVNASPHETPAAYFRDSHRQAPHNLYVRPSSLPVSGVDTGIMQAGPAPSGGVPVTARRISFAAATYDVTWSGGQWLLTFDGSRLVSTESGHVKAMTVVVQRVTVNQGRFVEDVKGTVSPVAVTTGSGSATVLRDGMAFEGTWSRSAAADPTRFTSQDGSALPVAPGPVWIMLVPR